MEEQRISTIDAISFSGRSLLHHVRLFIFILLIGSGIITVAVGLVALINKNFIQSITNSSMFQNIQQCIGSNCFTIAYQSGMPIIELITGNFISLLISAIILSLIFIGLDLGFRTITLDLYDHNTSTIDKLFSRIKMIPQGLVAWILYGLMVWAGFMFFIIPGFIILLRFAFFPFFIIDKNASAIESLKMSYHATSGHMWDIFSFFIAIKIAVYLCFLSYIGVILTWPLSTLAYAYVYRHITATNKMSFFTSSV